MIKLTGVENIASFIHAVDLAFAQMDRDLSRNYENFTKEVFGNIVRTTPQWTGDLASAWNYAIAYEDESYFSIPNKEEGRQVWAKTEVFERGAQPAVARALAKADGVHPTWRDVVYITNPAPIAQSVEDVRVLIRPVNLVDGRVAMIDYWYDRYTREARVIT